MKKALCSSPKSRSFQGLRVGVLAGGESPERKISLRSGKAVYSAIRRLGLRPLKIDPARRALFAARLKEIDLAFIALHGRGGEDGILQRRLEKRKLSYVGSGPLGCRLSFDKAQSKKVFLKHRIPTPPFCLVGKGNWEKRLFNFPAPMVLKPLKDGSSLGVFFVHDPKKDAPKIRKAVLKYGTLLAEKRIEGREFTVGILGSRALPVIELRPKRDFYDYRAKYTKGMTDYLVPAPVSRRLREKLQGIGLRVHKALGLRDFSRVDIMLGRDGKPYVLEANAIPGFTELSLLPKAAGAAGICFDELCLRLLGSAHQRSLNLSRGADRGKKKKTA